MLSVRGRGHGKTFGHNPSSHRIASATRPTLRNDAVDGVSANASQTHSGAKGNIGSSSMATAQHSVAPARNKRPLLRLCLDWTERRHHLGGHFGATLARGLFDRGYLRRREGQRAVDVTPAGDEFLRRELAIDLSH
jgi:hypothetical protein